MLCTPAWCLYIIVCSSCRWLLAEQQHCQHLVQAQGCCTHNTRHTLCAWQVNANAAAQVAAAKQASAEARAMAAADAERRIEESKAELARVKEQLASVLEYKQRKEVLEEEVAKLSADMAKLRADTDEQVRPEPDGQPWQQALNQLQPMQRAAELPQVPSLLALLAVQHQHSQTVRPALLLCVSNQQLGCGGNCTSHTHPAKSYMGPANNP